MQKSKNYQNLSEEISPSESSSNNLRFHSSFRALIQDVAKKEYAMFVNFEALDFNYRNYVCHVKNTDNFVFKKVGSNRKMF